MIRKRFILMAIAAILTLTMTALAAGCGEESTGGSADNGEKPVAANGDSKAAEIDACELVTKEDASRIFGKTAVEEEGSPAPGMLGECLWGYDTDTSGELIQFRIWDGEMYYAAQDGSEPLNLGDRGSIVVSGLLGVDIEWVQDGKTVSLSYFGTGPDAPAEATKVEPMKELARKVSEEL